MVFWLFKKRDDKLKELHERVSNSFENVRGDLSKVGMWIKHLENHRNEHSKKFDKIHERLDAIEEILSKNLEEHSNVQSFNRVQARSNQSFMNIQSLNDLITPKEKQIIMCLLDAEKPLEYKEIAKMGGISIITARRHLNDIKRSGLKIEEKRNIESNRKVFFIKNEVKNAILGYKEAKKIKK